VKNRLALGLLTIAATLIAACAAPGKAPDSTKADVGDTRHSNSISPDNGSYDYWLPPFGE
jgi:hypothetical protein